MRDDTITDLQNSWWLPHRERNEPIDEAQSCGHGPTRSGIRADPSHQFMGIGFSHPKGRKQKGDSRLAEEQEDPLAAPAPTHPRRPVNTPYYPTPVAAGCFPTGSYPKFRLSFLLFLTI